MAFQSAFPMHIYCCSLKPSARAYSRETLSRRRIRPWDSLSRRPSPPGPPSPTPGRRGIHHRAPASSSKVHRPRGIRGDNRPRLGKNIGAMRYSRPEMRPPHHHDTTPPRHHESEHKVRTKLRPQRNHKGKHKEGTMVALIKDCPLET